MVLFIVVLGVIVWRLLGYCFLGLLLFVSLLFVMYFVDCLVFWLCRWFCFVVGCLVALILVAWLLISGSCD